MKAESRFVKFARIAAAALIVGALGAGVYAQQQQQRPARPGAGWQGRGMRAGGPLAGMGLRLGQLNLTDEQKQQVKTILQGHKNDFRALGDRAMPARRALADAIASGDESAIKQKSADLAAVQTDRALLAAKVRSEVFKILTPDQQQKAQAMRQQFEQRMEQRRQAGPHKGGFGG